jgi:hypothetical protein
MKLLNTARNNGYGENHRVDKNIFFYNATTCPFSGLRGPPSWAWQECNRLLRVGRP